jgi:hypothetical protein
MPSNHENEYMVNLSMNGATRGGRRPDPEQQMLKEIEPVKVYNLTNSKFLIQLNVSKNITVGAFKDELEKRIDATVIKMHSEYFFPYTNTKPNSFWSGHLEEKLFKQDTADTQYPSILFVELKERVDTEFRTAMMGGGKDPSPYSHEGMGGPSPITRGSRPLPKLGTRNIREIERLTVVRLTANFTEFVDEIELDVPKDITVGGLIDLILQKTGLKVVRLQSNYFFPYTSQNKKSYWLGDTTEKLFKWNSVSLDVVPNFDIYIETDEREDPTAGTAT